MKLFNKVNPAGRCMYCGEEVHYKDILCPSCKKPNECWREIGENQCGNCHSYVDEGDAYCRICGTKVGEGKYEPYQEIMQCIYGPMPEERIHTCQDCGYSWKTMFMIDNQHYCPKCGGPAPAIEGDIQVQ